MALDQQYRKMLRDLMLQSDALAGQQTLPDGSIIGYGANNPDAMVSAVAPTPPMPDVQQVNQQPQTPQQLSALLVNQRPQGFNDQQRFDEAYQFKQAMPEKQSYLRNNTTGAVQMLPTGQSQVAAAPKNDFNDIIRFGNANGLDPQTIGKLVQYQGTVQAGMPSAKDLYAASFKYNRPIDEMLSMYGASAQAQRGQLQAEKERLGIDKARAEIAQLGAKPIDPEVSKQASLMRMYQSIPEGPMKQAFGEKHGFATKPEKRPDAELKKEAQMEGLGDAISQAKALLEGNATGQKDLPTGSGIGSMWDALAGQVGSTPSGATEAQRMKVLGGALTSKMPRMEGPQSDKDTQLYREMAGLVGDDTVPIPRRLDALDQVSKLWLKYEKPKSAATAYDAAKESRYQEWKKARGM